MSTRSELATEITVCLLQKMEMESIHVICTTWSYEEIKKVSQEPYWPFIFQKRRLQAI